MVKENVKTMLEKAKTKVVSAKNEAMVAGTALAMSVMTSEAVSANQAAGTMKNLLGTIMPYLAVIGVPIALMGGFKLIMAFRNDQGDAVPAAARDLAIGIIICLFATIGPAILNALPG
jgi:hypothetical protein